MSLYCSKHLECNLCMCEFHLLEIWRLSCPVNELHFAFGTIDDVYNYWGVFFHNLADILCIATLLCCVPTVLLTTVLDMFRLLFIKDCSLQLSYKLHLHTVGWHCSWRAASVPVVKLSTILQILTFGYSVTRLPLVYWHTSLKQCLTSLNEINESGVLLR